MTGGYIKHTLVRIGIILMAVVLPIPALAEDPIATLDTITVTAERFPVREKESSRFVTVISSEELEESGANNLTDALQRSGGFAYKAMAPMGISQGGMNSTLTIRGIRDGELILINGSPIQGAASHAYDLNTIPVDQIERVEILKGAASTLYGADAMSGVINIITKKTRDQRTLKAALEFGNESYHNHSLSATVPRLNLGFNYQHLGELEEISRSFSRNYQYNIDKTDKYSWNLNAMLAGNLYLDYIGSYYTTGFKQQYDDPDRAHIGTDQDYFKNFANLRYENTSFRAKAFATYDEMKRDEYTDPDASEDNNKNYNYGLEGDYKFQLSDWDFNLGADWTLRVSDYNNQYGKHHRNDYALFGQVKKTLADRLIVTVGAREQFVDGASGASDYDKLLPSVGLTFTATDSLNFFANSGMAFRAPTFNDLYYESSFLVGNPKLEPEEGWTHEIGLKYDSNALRLRLSGFYMAYEDKIELDRSHGYPLTYFNAGDYDSKGVEWEVGMSPFVQHNGWSRDLCLYTNGYWADPTAEDTSGKEYQTGPRLQATVGLNYFSEPLTVDLNCQILTARERDLESYNVFNIYTKYKLWKGCLTFGVDNIFDTEVQVSGDLSDDASNRYVYYEVGRLVKIGYEITL